MINIRKRNNLYEYRFEAGKINGKRKQISKSGFKTKSEAYLAGQKAYEEFISGESTKECNMLYSEYLDYWMREYFEINYKYSTAKRYKESFGDIKKELGNYKLSAITSFSLNQALLRLYQTSTTKDENKNNEVAELNKSAENMYSHNPPKTAVENNILILIVSYIIKLTVDVRL